MIKIDDSSRIDVINFGAFAYSPEQIAMILQEDLKQVKADLADPNSDLHKLYNHGQATAKYMIDKKLFDQAKNGDLKSLEEIEFRNPKMKERLG